MKSTYIPVMSINRSPKSKHVLKTLGFKLIFQNEAESFQRLYNSYILDIPSKNYCIGSATKMYPHISIDVLPALVLMQPEAIVEFCKGLNK